MGGGRQVGRRVGRLVSGWIRDGSWARRRASRSVRQ